VHGSTRVIFVGLRISKVHDLSITLVLRPMPSKLVHDLSA
jgi:hypothetical protein